MDKTTLDAVAVIVRELREELRAEMQRMIDETRSLATASIQESRENLLTAIENAQVRIADGQADALDDLADQLRDQVAGGREAAATAMNTVREELAEELRLDIKLAQQSMLMELQAQLDAVSTVLADERAHADESRDAMVETLAERLRGEIKDGRDGVDRWCVSPRLVAQGDQVERGEIVVFDGGIFQSKRKATGTPGEDPFSYIPIVNGVAEIKLEHDDEQREVRYTARLSDGQVQSLAIATGPQYVADIASAKVAGDWTIDGSDLLVFTGESTDRIELTGPPGIQGARGRKGKPGEPGKGIEAVYAEGNLLVVETTDGETVAIDINEIVRAIVTGRRNSEED